MPAKKKAAKRKGKAKGKLSTKALRNAVGGADHPGCRESADRVRVMVTEGEPEALLKNSWGGERDRHIDAERIWKRDK